MKISHIIGTVDFGRPTLIDCLACFVLPVLSLFADRLQIATGINTSILALACIVLALISAIYRGGRVVRIPRGMLLTIALVAIICMNSLVQGSEIIDAAKPVLLMAFICIAGSQITPAGVRLFIGAIIVMSVVVTVDAMLNIGEYASEGLNLYNVRQSTIVDKPIYTILYALSISLIVSYFSKLQNNVVRLSASALIAVETYFGFSVIESKTFLFAVALAAVVFYFISARIGKANVMIPLVIFVAASLLLLLLYLHPEYVPDSVRSLLSNLMGIDISYSARYDGTYIGRSSITATALSEFAQHPIGGVGFGNFTATFVWSGTEYAVGQTESSWLSFLTEGGIVYFLIQVVLNVFLVIRLYRRATRIHDVEATAMLLVLIVFGALNVVNDFANNFYWCALAIAYGLVNRETESTRDRLPSRALQMHYSVMREGNLYGSYQ